MRRVVIKLGSSVVADHDRELRRETLARVCDAAAEGDCQDAVVLKLRRAQPHSRNVEAALELALFFFILVTLLDGPQVLQL